MHWFLIALLGPLFWSITNHIDKFLLTKYFKGGGTGSLMIFSSFAGIFVLPLIYIFEPNVLVIKPQNALLIMISSAAFMTYILPYFYALTKDETSIVAPLFQMVPIISYLLGYFVLGETLTLLQILASVLIIAGAVIISLDLDNSSIRLKKDILVLMFLSSFLFAFGGLLFKIVGVDESFLVTSFWSYLGYGIIGIFLFTFVTPYRKQFLYVLKKNNTRIIGVNIINEICNVIAQSATAFATLLVPLALAHVVAGVQPFFVLSIGILITHFFPSFGKESLLKKHLVQKILAIIIIFLGTYLLNY